MTRQVLPVAHPEQPANVALIYDDRCNGVDDNPVQATVDGRPAQLRELELPLGPSGRAFAVEPRPVPGSQVTVVAATDMDPDRPRCQVPDPISFTAGPVDVSAPHSPVLNVSHVADSLYELSCPGSARRYDAVRFRVSITPDPSDQEPVTYAAQLLGRAGVVDRSGPALAHPRGGPIELQLWAAPDDLGEDGNHCVVVHTFDVAGNEAEPVEYCDFVDSDAVFGPSCSVGQPSRAAVWMLLLLGAFSRRRSTRSS